MLVFVPMVPERPEAAFLCSNRSLEFVIEPVYPRLVFARHGGCLLLAYLGDVVQMAFDFIEKALAFFAFLRHPIQVSDEIARIMMPRKHALCESDQ